MSDAATTSILKRKAVDGLNGHKARSMSPEKAMRLGMALSAQNGMGLACEVTRVQRSMVSHETLVGMLDSESLLAILEGENGAGAALAIDIQVMSGLVEHQTLGRVLPHAAAPRTPTLVDAALVTPFVEDTVARFVTLMSTDEAPGWLQHYKFGAVTEDTRTLSLSLKSHDYHFLLMDISLDGGAKSGTLGIAFPDFQPEVELPQEVDEAETPAGSFQAGVLQAHAALTAVVGRLHMTIGDMQHLQVGQVITLPVEATKETTLESVEGGRVTAVKLGQINGMRAVRLVEAIVPAGADDNASQDMSPPMPEMDVAEPMTVSEPAPLPEPAAVPVPEPEVPDLPDLDAAMEGLGDFNMDDLGMPDLPDVGGPSDLPDIGGLPDLPDVGGLPDLPDLDSLPDLPDLADLPDLDLTGS
ncbi:flagellar motor switch protein FliM [Shimia isoporae]|uniref:Flagellar motor switch protein FliM n=1 Tax=Shimia isoporae TaxID=647720 RepID=A0A4R1NLP5_9RHOB|nr:FliM/FliN family flagellar motor C-terminal domain-containing protein [Shimia isoporae]TCL09035.1 flagellar motor switch protein FliM [Shimia isoporae]